VKVKARHKTMIPRSPPMGLATYPVHQLDQCTGCTIASLAVGWRTDGQDRLTGIIFQKTPCCSLKSVCTAARLNLTTLHTKLSFIAKKIKPLKTSSSKVKLDDFSEI
jgi:hypothetical protein